MRRLENVYFQFSEELVDESALESYGFQIAAFQTPRCFKDFWVTRNERRAYHPGFVRYFENRAGLATK